MLTDLGFNEVPIKLIDEFLSNKRVDTSDRHPEVFIYFYLNENNISEISNLIEYLKDKGDRRITVNLTDNPIKKLPENYLDINFAAHNIDFSMKNFEDITMREVPMYELPIFVRL